MAAGRPRNKEPTKYLGARVPASVFDPVKGFADAHAEKMSSIVVEALKLYTRQVIEHRCRLCETKNREDAGWCYACGAPLSDEAKISHRQQIEETRHRDKLNLQSIHFLEYYIKNQLPEVKKQFQAHEKCLDNREEDGPPHPDDEQTPDIDPK